MSANDHQPGGNHYQNKTIQPWDYIIANNLDWCQGNIVKYVTRFREKNGLKDLKKAQHYLEKLIEVETEKLNKEEIMPILPKLEVDRINESYNHPA